MSKRTALTKGMISHIHWEKDSGGPEVFYVTIHVKSMQEINSLQRQLLAEYKKYPELEKIKQQLKHTTKKNQTAQKQAEAKLEDIAI